jgi:hypothetical protein
MAVSKRYTLSTSTCIMILKAKCGDGHSRTPIGVSKKSPQILNIFTARINTARECAFHHMTAQMSKFYVRHLFYPANMNVRMRVSGHLNTGWTFCEQQGELRSKCSEKEKGREAQILSSCFMWWKLYSPSCLFSQQKCWERVHSSSDTCTFTWNSDKGHKI